MSIEGELREAIQQGRLCRFELEFDSDPYKRTILLHPEVLDDIYDDDPTYARRMGRLRGDLEMFVKGQHISMSMTPFGHKAAYMGLLDPPKDGSWEIRSRDPSPGLRLFGKFPCCDVFVGLVLKPRSVDWRHRKALGDGNSLEYQLAAIETNKRWDRALPNLRPLIGGTVSDYLSEKVSIVGN